jgi:hypothetical protein
MNKDKNPRTGNEQQSSEGQQRGQNMPAPGQKEQVSHSGEGNTMNVKEKKPISHRTGDATNFGERSYRED